MALLWFFLTLIKCEPKYLCFTTGPVSNYRCTSENTVTEVTNETDFTPLITSRITNADKDIYIFLSGPIEFEFPFDIFSGKNITVRFTDSSASGLFDLTDTSNIDINFVFLNQRTTNPIVTLLGTSFNQPQSSFTLQNINLTADFTDFKVKSFTSIHSTFTIPKIATNSFIYHIDSDLNVNINNNKIVLDERTIEFLNDDSSLEITFSPSHKLTVTNDGTDNSLLPKLSVENANSITFNGNTYSKSNSISLTNCPLLIPNIDYLPLSSTVFTDSITILKIIISNSITINGISLNKRQNLTIDVPNKPVSSRISVNIDSISLESGYVQFLSSWIDLVVNDFKFKGTALPISPCLGSGGSSTFVAKEVSLENEEKSFELDPLYIQLDITGSQTDQTLSKLISQAWESIKFEKISDSIKNEGIETILFTPSDINGFGSTKESRIIEATTSLTEGLIITIKASSLNTIPLLICYTDSNSCAGGIAINDLTKLSEIIPNDQKSINLSIAKEDGEIDLTNLKVTGATFSIVQAKKSSATVNSIIMDEEFPNKKISHLFLQSIHFGSGSFYFNAEKITFELCKATELPNISFNENGVLYIDDYSYDQLNSRIEGIYPLTNFVTIIDQRYSTLEITESKYLFKDSYTEREFPFHQIPKVVFNIGLQSNDDYNFEYKVSTSVLDSVTLKFASHKLYSTTFNPKVTINLDNFEIVEKANKVEIDFDGLNSGNTINLNYVPQHNYFAFNGENVVIKNAAAKQENNFCVCKSTPCSAEFCENDMNQISYSELNEKIQAVSDDVVKVTIVGEQDGSSPVLSLAALNNKNAKIFGVGTNPTIKLDCTTQFTSQSHKIEFNSIKIGQSGGQSLQISNLVLNQDCTIDSSFGSVSFTVDCLQCFVSHLVFSSLNVKKLLKLEGDATNTQSSTKVTFSSSSNFSYSLPSKITIKEASLVFNNLEFNLANVLPSFSFGEELTDFTIVGENANLDPIASDLIITQSPKLKSVYVKGTWTNNNPNKFVSFDKFSSNLYLDSDNIPLNIFYLTNEKIILERELVHIIGKITFKGSYSGNYEISTSSSVGSKRSTLSIKNAHISSGIANVQFATTNINLNIGTYTSESVSPKFKFFLLIDLDGQNFISITNPYLSDVEFTYDIHCTIDEKLNDPRMINFINTNHSLISVNQENKVKLADSITFDDDATLGFNNNNFKLDVINGNNLIFYTFKSPLVSSIDFYYGSCSSCSGNQLKKEDLTKLDELIPISEAEITITFYESLEGNNYIDLNKQKLNIHSLTLKSSFSAVKKDVNIILGKSVSYLLLDCISLHNVDDDSISLKKATLRKGSSFSKNANIANIEEIEIDEESLFYADFDEFRNTLNLNIESSTYITFNYTKNGMKIIKSFNSQTSVFDIDVSKMPNVYLLVNAKKTPKINLEKGVTELKQIKSLIFDSSTFVIGSNWDKLSDSEKVEYSFNSPKTDVIIITDSFPFYSWDLMYQYTIQFSGVLAPFTYSDEFSLHNENISLSTYIPTHHKYSDIIFNELSMSGKSTIAHGEETTTKKLIINELTVEDDSIADAVNANIKDSLELEEGSILQNNFVIDPYVLKIKIEWDLNHIPLLNPSLLQTIHPGVIEIIYKGDSIEGKEIDFDNLLLNGLTIMKNVDLSDKTLTNNVHFKSDSEDVFEDGDKLSLKLQKTEKNDIQIVLTRSLLGQSISPSTQTQTATQTVTHSNPTQQPEPTVPVAQPSVDDSYHLMSDKITFMKDGYRDDDMAVSTESNKNEILLIRARTQHVRLTTETSEEPRQHLYLSPNNDSSELSIDDLDDYGLGEFGIHANSHNPIVKLPTSSVPLNLYNDESSEVTFELNTGSTGSSLKIPLSLKKLTLNKGALKIEIPHLIHSVEFNEVETYQKSRYEAMQNGSPVKMTVNKLTVKDGSTIQMPNAKFTNSIVLGLDSKVEIESEATFNENSVIEVTKSSFIELGTSKINGVCKQIKMVEKSSLKLNDDEVNIQLICGRNFNCSLWKDKYVGDDTFKKAKCSINKNKETCLVVTDSYEEEKGKISKKSFPWMIVGIVVGAVGVASILATVIYRFVKKRKATKGYVSQPNIANTNIDEVLVNDGNLDI